MFISRAHGHSVDRIVKCGKTCRASEKVRRVLLRGILSGVGDAARFTPLRQRILIYTDESSCFTPCQAYSFHWFPLGNKKPRT